MKKTFKIFSFVFTALFVLLGFSFIKTNALSYDENGFENDYDHVITSGMAYYMSTQYGEDASHEARFHYQSTQNNTYIMFTKASDTEWKDSKRLEVTCTEINYFDPPTGSDGKVVGTEGFPEVPFYEIEAEVSDLDPGTEYMWYATDGVTKSRLMRFETAPDTNAPFTFGFVSDTQVYAETGINNYSKASNEHVYDLIENKLALDSSLHMNFMVNLGDTVENAGRANYWDYYWNHAFMQRFASMNCIGNHDFTGLVSSGTVDGRFWASQYNMPRNGADCYPETTYYFYYGDCLFIMLSSAGGARQAEYVWLENLLKNNTSQYVIASVHYPCNQESGDTTKEFIPLFDKYGVDLVLQGHGHSFVLWQNYYNMKKVNSGEGTTYMEMGSPNFGDGRAIFALITVSESGIKVENYNFDGVLVNNFLLQPKRPATSKIQEMNEDEFIESFNVEVEPINRTSATVSFGDMAYGNLSTIRLLQGDRVLLDKTIYGTRFNTATISGLSADSDYECKLQLVYRDGTTKEVDYNFTTKITSYATLTDIVDSSDEDYFRMTYNVTYHPTVTNVYSYLNGAEYKELSMKSGRITIDNEDLLDGVNTVELIGKLNDGTLVTLYTWTVGEEPKEVYSISYDLDGGSCEGLVLEFLEDEFPTLPTPTKANCNFLGWFEGETKVTEINENRNYELKAKWEEINVNPTEPSEPTEPIEPTEPEPTPAEPTEEPEPTEPVTPAPVDPSPTEPEKKSGCKNLVSSLFMILVCFGFVLIRRKRF